jgi:hypothetical protein
MRRLDNIEGAFPLLVIGSVLLIYAGIVANQEIGSSSSRLPLWGLMAAVGAVIVGAGIYSTTLEPTVPPSSRPSPVETVGRRIETYPERFSDRAKAPHVSRVAAETSWWEGPSETVTSPPAISPRATVGERATRRRPEPVLHTRRAEPLRPPPVASAAERTRSGLRPASPEGTGTPVRGPRSSKPVLPPRRHGSLNDLESILSELEDLVDRQSRSPPAPPRSESLEEASLCVDCDRALARTPPPDRCAGCGRWMCSACAASSLSEDGELKCIECRARAS